MKLPEHLQFSSHLLIWQKLAGCLSLLILASCANIVPPTGGDKDTTPPKAVEVRPPSESLNFDGDQIIFRFDEFVEIKNAKELVLSPYSESAPKLSLKGKKLLVSFTEPLLENTTYSLSFGKCIADITEGNFATDLYYAFSTGPIIDSLSLDGKCLRSPGNENYSELNVGLFSPEDDPSSTKPKYRTLSGSDGSFSFRNLGPSPFHLIAWDDQNGNLILDEGESRGFVRDELVAGQDSDLIVAVFSEKEEAILKEVVNKEKGRLGLALNRYASEVSVSMVGADLVARIDISKDSIVLYYLCEMDSFLLIARDNESIDSMELKTVLAETEFDSTLQCKTRQIELRLNDPIIVEFAYAISSVNNARVQVLKDGRSLDSTKYEILQRGPYLELKTHIETLSEYQLFINDSAVLAYTGAFNSADTFSFRSPNLKEYGSLSFSSDDSLNTDSLLIELYDKDKNSLGFLHKRLPKGWKYLEEGTYSLAITKDENGNLRYDTGSYQERKQPEKTYWLQDFIIVKANSENIVTAERVLSALE